MGDSYIATLKQKLEETLVNNLGTVIIKNCCTLDDAIKIVKRKYGIGFSEKQAFVWLDSYIDKHPKTQEFFDSMLELELINMDLKAEYLPVISEKRGLREKTAVMDNIIQKCKVKEQHLVDTFISLILINGYSSEKAAEILKLEYNYSIPKKLRHYYVNDFIKKYPKTEIIFNQISELNQKYASILTDADYQTIRNEIYMSKKLEIIGNIMRYYKFRTRKLLRLKDVYGYDLTVDDQEAIMRETDLGKKLEVIDNIIRDCKSMTSKLQGLDDGHSSVLTENDKIAITIRKYDVENNNRTNSNSCGSLILTTSVTTEEGHRIQDNATYYGNKFVKALEHDFNEFWSLYSIGDRIDTIGGLILRGLTVNEILNIFAHQKICISKLTVSQYIKRFREGNPQYGKIIRNMSRINRQGVPRDFEMLATINDLDNDSEKIQKLEDLTFNALTVFHRGRYLQKMGGSSVNNGAKYIKNRGMSK